MKIRIPNTFMIVITPNTRTDADEELMIDGTGSLIPAGLNIILFNRK